MILFWAGLLSGFPLGFVSAIVWSHWLDMLYEPKLTVSEEADEYVRAQPHWRRQGP